jgi:hypothetical protein
MTGELALLFSLNTKIYIRSQTRKKEMKTFFFRWNQLDVAIVLLSVLGIVLEEMKSDLMPINPTIMRVMRVLRIARGNKY